MEVPVKKCHLEVTEDKVDSPSQKSSLPTKNFSTKGIPKSFEPKPMKKDFSKHPYWRSKPLLKCQHCPFKSYFPAGFKRHTMMHDKNAKVNQAQTEPDTELTSESSIDQATSQADLSTNKYQPGAGSFKCHLCSYSSGRRSTLTNHKGVVHDLSSKGNPLPIGAFWCQDCEFTCVSEPILDKHIEDHHPERIAPYKPRYKCSKCEFNTTYRFVMERHKRVHLPSRNDTTCTVCGIMTADEESYQKHLMRHKVKKASKPARVAVKPRRSPRQGARRRAVHSGANAKIYPCPFCPSRFSYRYNMAVHVENVHKRTKDVAYAMMDYLEVESNRNVARETTSSDFEKNVATICILKQDTADFGELQETDIEENLTFGCSLCPFTFNLRPEARFHCELAHKDRMPMLYECSICNTSTKYFSEMVRHLHKHVVHRAEPAEVCEADGQSSIKQHLFSCVHCDLKFESKKEFKRHKRSVHYTSDTLFKCSKCEYTSLDRSDVTRHLKESHVRGGKSI